MKSIQHKLLHIAFCLSIGFSIAQANLPVIDVSSIAQSIMQYTQMIQESIKYEKELRKIGIDTGRIGGILQNIDNIGRDMIQGIDTLNKTPNEFAQMFQRLNKGCEFFAQTERFKNAQENLLKGYENIDKDSAQVLSCLNAFNNPLLMIDIKNEIQAKADEYKKKGDFVKYREELDKIKDIETERAYQRAEVKDEKLRQWAKFYQQYQGVQGDKNNPYNIYNIRENMKIIIEKAGKAETQTEVQNLTNALLGRILELATIQYEMLATSNSVMIEFLDKQEMESKRTITRESRAKDKENQKKIFEEDEAFSQYKDAVQYNDAGLPKMFE